MTIFRAASLLAALTFPGAAPPSSRDLPFQQRLDAQRTIERFYYAHQAGATRPFEEAVPDAILEKKVRTYLRQSAALKELWRTPITEEALGRELQRIAGATRMPDRLRELYAALDDDSFLIQETLARPALVDRLARGFYAYDGRFHAAARRQAEVLRESLASGRLDPAQADARRSVIELELETAKPGASDERGPLHASEAYPVDAEQFRRLRSLAPSHLNEIGGVTEERDQFVVRVALSEQPGRARIASYAVPKVAWDVWWAQAQARFDEADVQAVASSSMALPEPAGGGSASLLSPCGIDDVWEATGISAPPPERARHTAVWTGSLMIVWGGQGPIGFFDYLNTGGRYDPLTDSWSPTSTVNAPAGRVRHTAVWTGTRMIVWGGVDQNFTALLTGGRYDPVADTWAPTTTLAGPQQRYRHVAVWTGSVMVIWGGSSSGTYLATGGRYNPNSDSWQSMSFAITPREAPGGLWTGSRVLVWGGTGAAGFLGTGGLYDPVGNTWTNMTASGAPAARDAHTLVWTGSRAVVWGGGSGAALNTGGRYDPATDTWSTTSASQAPQARVEHTAAWTGSRMVVWGGSSGGANLGTGGMYDPVNDLWSGTQEAGAPSPRSLHTAAWTGSLMIVWGGQEGGTAGAYLNSGGRFDPNSNSWTPASVVNVPERREGHTALWTGNEMLVWGGLGVTVVLNTGGRFDPVMDTWSTTSTTGAPSPRQQHSAVWTGNEMIIWGGSAAGGGGGGGRYDPISDSWMPTSAAGEPSTRTGHSAIWTGREMVVWGGLAGTYLNSGGRYDPAADTWSSTSIVAAPAPRLFHSSVWTGEEMLVWGGRDTAALDSGSRYDPDTDQWAPMSSTSAASPRLLAPAVWTGSLMLVWGGTDGTNRLGTGARYDPAGDTWSPMSSTSAPTARMGHTFVWTGSRAVVWGGSSSSTTRLDTGGRYDPTADAWTHTVNFPAPPPREKHSAVWTGRQLLIWGGSDNGRLYTGGSYSVAPTVAWVTPPPAAVASGQSYPVSWRACGIGTICHHHVQWGVTNPQTNCADGDPACSTPVQCGAQAVYTDLFQAPVVGTATFYTVAAHAQFGGGQQWSPWVRTLVEPVCSTPGEVLNLDWSSDGTIIGWDQNPGAQRYDVMYGSLQDAGIIGSSGSEQCLADEYAGTQLADTSPVPPPDSGWYYLVRATAACGNGSYGRSSSNQERVTAGCP